MIPRLSYVDGAPGPGYGIGVKVGHVIALTA